MFGSIAGRYDFLNHFLSANIDRRWRRICVRETERRIEMPLPKILDIGCGTADLSLAFSRVGTVFGCDFSHPMLRIGAKKIAGSSVCAPIYLFEADALTLPFTEASFDVVTSAFVLRNLADIDRGFYEMRRVLRPGGIMSVLEFGMPKISFLLPLYRCYFLKILPRLGRLISGVDGPYGYLPSSVQAFPPVEELQETAARAGFVDLECRRLTAGIAILLTGRAGDGSTDSRRPL